MTIHRANMRGRPRCGAPEGRISTSGVFITCEACRLLDAPDLEAQRRAIEEAAARFRASRELQTWPAPAIRRLRDDIEAQP